MLKLLRQSHLRQAMEAWREMVEEDRMRQAKAFHERKLMMQV